MITRIAEPVLLIPFIGARIHFHNPSSLLTDIRNVRRDYKNFIGFSSLETRFCNDLSDKACEASPSPGSPITISFEKQNYC
ncbi:MAG: hypothetical protein IPM38_09430 [Ignavibacteria bacterium]|nr:hypothetical protein [Ignavibacteria bacterium]